MEKRCQDDRKEKYSKDGKIMMQRVNAAHKYMMILGLFLSNLWGIDVSMKPFEPKMNISYEMMVKKSGLEDIEIPIKRKLNDLAPGFLPLKIPKEVAFSKLLLEKIVDKMKASGRDSMQLDGTILISELLPRYIKAPFPTNTTLATVVKSVMSKSISASGEAVMNIPLSTPISVLIPGFESSSFPVSTPLSELINPMLPTVVSDLGIPMVHVPVDIPITELIDKNIPLPNIGEITINEAIKDMIVTSISQTSPFTITLPGDISINDLLPMTFPSFEIPIDVSIGDLLPPGWTGTMIPFIDLTTLLSDFWEKLKDIFEDFKEIWETLKDFIKDIITTIITTFFGSSSSGSSGECTLLSLWIEIPCTPQSCDPVLECVMKKQRKSLKARLDDLDNTIKANIRQTKHQTKIIGKEILYYKALKARVHKEARSLREATSLTKQIRDSESLGRSLDTIKKGK